MLRVALMILLPMSLCGCPTPFPSGFPEQTRLAACNAGDTLFNMRVVVPPEYGEVLALTQQARISGELRSVCLLHVPTGPNGRVYSVQSGELLGGVNDVCLSARTTIRGRVQSCIPAAAVQQVTAEHTGRGRPLITVSAWQSHPGS